MPALVLLSTGCVWADCMYKLGNSDKAGHKPRWVPYGFLTTSTQRWGKADASEVASCQIRDSAPLHRHQKEIQRPPHLVLQITSDVPIWRLADSEGKCSPHPSPSMAGSVLCKHAGMCASEPTCEAWQCCFPQGQSFAGTNNWQFYVQGSEGPCKENGKGG